MNNKKTVLVYIEQDHKYLLIHKQKPDMNFNKYMGVGGKIEAGESPKEAALREAFEETGLTLLDLTFNAKIFFHSQDYIEEMYLYTATSFIGTLQSSSEGTLMWVPKDAIKNLPMWEGDIHFLEKLHEKNLFEMHLYYEGEKLVRVSSGPLV